MIEVEPPLRMLTPDGRWAIEVSESAGGPFYAAVILDGKTLIDSLSTDSDTEIISWVTRQMHEALRRTNNEQPRKTR